MGIRKVHGATAPSLTILLVKDFVKLVLIAVLIAWPLAYIFMRRWLETFAYRINQNPVDFAAAGLAARGARHADPVDSSASRANEAIRIAACFRPNSSAGRSGRLNGAAARADGPARHSSAAAPKLEEAARTKKAGD